MITLPLLAYLEVEVFFPVLRADAAMFPGRKKKLVLAQCAVINALREVYYSAEVREDAAHIFSITQGAGMADLWKLLAGLGFKTPLDVSVQVGLADLLPGGNGGFTGSDKPAPDGRLAA